MKWVSMMFDKANIQPSICHPDYAETREGYVLEEYGSFAVKKEEVEDLWMDFGGMIHTKDPRVTVQVDLYRTFSCWKHQISDVISMLGECKKIEHQGVVYFRFARWPIGICFISEEDAEKVIEGLLTEQDEKQEDEHREQMREALIKANVRDGGPEKEKKVRAFFNSRNN